MRWGARRCWSPTGHQSEHDFQSLETICQFAENSSLAWGGADTGPLRTCRLLRRAGGRDTHPVGGPRQAEAYSWLTVEMANLRLAFRWAADHGDLDTAATIAYYAAFVGFWGEQHEPIRWAEELVEPARSVEHGAWPSSTPWRRCVTQPERIEDAVGYAAAGQTAVASGCSTKSARSSNRRSAAYTSRKVSPSGGLSRCCSVIARRPGTRLHVQACLVLALKFAGEGDQAIAASEDLLAAADAWDNRNLARWALFAYGTARAD